MLPWAELEGLHEETSLIKDQLLALNAAGKSKVSCFLQDRLWKFLGLNNKRLRKS